MQKGLLALQHGDVSEARSDLEQASRDDPHNPYVWSSLAEVYLRAHEAELASTAAQRAEKESPGDPIVEHALALYYSHAGDFGHAAKLEELYASSPRTDKQAKARTSAWYLVSGNDAKALAIAKSIAADGEQTFELAQLFLRDQQFQDAAELLQAGLKEHPQDPQLTLALGVARYGERRFDEAIAEFLKVIHLSPDVEQPYLFLSRMLDQAGAHLQEIVLLTRKWANKNPSNGAAQLALAKALLAQDPASTEAEPLLGRAVELDPKNWEAHYELGLVLESSRQFAAAAEQLQDAVELDRSQPMPHYHLARVYDRLGKPDQAAVQRAIHDQLVNTSKPK